jgi:hypothetical protein
MDAYKTLVEAHFDDVKTAVTWPRRAKIGENTYRDICGCVYNSDNDLKSLGEHCSRVKYGEWTVITHADRMPEWQTHPILRVL